MNKALLFFPGLILSSMIFMGGCTSDAPDPDPTPGGGGVVVDPTPAPCNVVSTTSTCSFKTSQKNGSRVAGAYNTNYNTLKADLLEETCVDIGKLNVFLRIFKEENELEVWVKNNSESQYKHFRTYVIARQGSGTLCSNQAFQGLFPGKLGPKLHTHDFKSPEGCYKMRANATDFNNTSNYHLSLEVGYPNAADNSRYSYYRSQLPNTIKSSIDCSSSNMSIGSAIKIHGNQVSVGCFAMTDAIVEKIYLLCLEASCHQSEIKMNIFPYKMTGTKHNSHINNSAYNQDVKNFWNSLKPIYEHFEANQTVPNWSSTSNGNYILN
jgi:murein L,D-transpeptidase YafK